MKLMDSQDHVLLDLSHLDPKLIEERLPGTIYILIKSLVD